jgi:sugar phosphate isomerase/epimerase
MALSRRDFLSISGMTASGIALSAIESLGKPLNVMEKPGYSLLIMATNWGFDGSYDQFASRIKKDGYDGAEIWYPGDVAQVKDLVAVFKKYELKLAFLFGSGEADVKKNYEYFKSVVDAMVQLKPVYFNCHSGKDFFSYDDNKKFIDLTTQVAKSSGIPIYHETHRGRMLYSAPVTRQFIEKNPDLRITFDVSHWCNVHESSLWDQPETLAMTLDRVDHIHARIGHAEGPQVNDPRAPEWQDYVKAHFAWWDKVVERKKQEGKIMTFLTEFGPVDYMPALPYTRTPVANQWEINGYMKDVLRKRYT